MCALVLFIHGAGGGSWEWQIWQRVFAAQGVSNHTLSLQPYPNENADEGFVHTTYDYYLSQVEQALRLTQAHIVIGASLGGLLAAELAAASKPGALVLVAPIPKAGISVSKPSVPKRWAASADLLNTARALPDADAASAMCAHHQWRDESQHVLGAAYAGRAFSDYSGATLMLLAENERDLPNDALRKWAFDAAMDVQLIEGASHAGLLLGRHAATAAESVLHWLRARFLLKPLRPS